MAHCIGEAVRKKVFSYFALKNSAILLEQNLAIPNKIHTYPLNYITSGKIYL